MSKPATYAAVLVVHPTTGDVLVRRWPNGQANLPGAVAISTIPQRTVARDALRAAVRSVTAVDIPVGVAAVKHSPQHDSDTRKVFWPLLWQPGWELAPDSGCEWVSRYDLPAALAWPWRAQSIARISRMVLAGQWSRLS